MKDTEGLGAKRINGFGSIVDWSKFECTSKRMLVNILRDLVLSSLHFSWRDPMLRCSGFVFLTYLRFLRCFDNTEILLYSQTLVSLTLSDGEQV